MPDNARLFGVSAGSSTKPHEVINTFFRLPGIHSNHSLELYIINLSNEKDHFVQVRNKWFHCLVFLDPTSF